MFVCDATTFPMKRMWSPVTISFSRMHSKFAAASLNKTESIISVFWVLQPVTSSLSMSRPLFVPKKRVSASMFDEG